MSKRKEEVTQPIPNPALEMSLQHHAPAALFVGKTRYPL